MKNWSFFGFLVWKWSILMGETKALEYFFTLDLMSQRNAVPILTNWRLRSTIWKPNNFFKFNYRRRRRSIESTWWWFYEKITKSNNWSWLSVAATAWWLRLPVQMGSVEAEIALSIYLVSQSSVVSFRSPNLKSQVKFVISLADSTRHTEYRLNSICRCWDFLTFCFAIWNWDIPGWVVTLIYLHVLLLLGSYFFFLSHSFDCFWNSRREHEISQWDTKAAACLKINL